MQVVQVVRKIKKDKILHMNIHKSKLNFTACHNFLYILRIALSAFIFYRKVSKFSQLKKINKSNKTFHLQLPTRCHD